MCPPGSSAGRDRPGRPLVARERARVRLRDGHALDRRDVTSRQFKPLLRRAKLPETTRFHDLRHTCATPLLTKNVNPKFVSEMLGHSNIAITLDTYSHVLPSMQDSAARALEEALR
jgi:integrase